MSGQTFAQPLPVYIGFDHRQAVSYNVLQFSIFRRSSKPVTISPLVLPSLPITRQGLTPFTYSRFLVPWLNSFQGWALFLDTDFLCLADISELFALCDNRYAAMVSKNACSALPKPRSSRRGSPAQRLMRRSSWRRLRPGADRAARCARCAAQSP
mgnify:CR=1 FL=1